MSPEQLIVGRDLGYAVKGNQLLDHIDLEIGHRRIL